MCMINTDCVLDLDSESAEKRLNVGQNTDSAVSPVKKRLAVAGPYLIPSSTTPLIVPTRPIGNRSCLAAARR